MYDVGGESLELDHVEDLGERASDIVICADLDEDDLTRCRQLK